MSLRRRTPPVHGPGGDPFCGSRRRPLAAAALIAAFTIAAPACAQPSVPAPSAATPAAPPGTPPAALPSMLERGRLEFESNCATCHGMEARGDGPMRPFLARVPSDLTTIARRRGGTFPRTEIADLIDGRGMTEPGVHGTREMPVWGRVYREQSEAQTRGTPFPAEWGVRGRILALAEYLQSLQRP